MDENKFWVPVLVGRDDAGDPLWIDMPFELDAVRRMVRDLDLAPGLRARAEAFCEAMEPGSNTTAIARLADPGALGRAALEGGYVDVVVSVPVAAFGEAYRLMRPIMDDGTPYLEEWLVEDGRSETELRLLCGLFHTVENNLPMDTCHHLKRLEMTGSAQALDEFTRRRAGRMAPVDYGPDTIFTMLWQKIRRDPRTLNSVLLNCLDFDDVEALANDLALSLDQTHDRVDELEHA